MHFVLSIQIRGDCEEVAENLALALSVIVLFVLCEPREEVSVTSIKEGGYQSNKYRDIMGKSLI